MAWPVGTRITGIRWDSPFPKGKGFELDLEEEGNNPMFAQGLLSLTPPSSGGCAGHTAAHIRFYRDEPEAAGSKRETPEKNLRESRDVPLRM